MARARLAVLLLVLIVVAACAGTSPSTTPASSQTAARSAEASPDDTAPSGTPSASEEPAPTDEPAATDAPAATDEPAATASPSEAAPSSATANPSPSAAVTPDPGIAAACSGSAANREFYVHVASAVDWPVYCPVLPNGWFVSTGSYRLAGGGKLVIAYRGPGSTTIALSEGSFCSDADGCVPTGTDAGAAPFGPRQGTLVKLDGGGYAVVVNRGARPSWLLVTSGLDEAETVSISGALAEVAD